MLCSGGGGISVAHGMQAGVWLSTHAPVVTSALTLSTVIPPKPNFIFGRSQRFWVSFPQALQHN